MGPYSEYVTRYDSWRVEGDKDRYKTVACLVSNHFLLLRTGTCQPKTEFIKFGLPKNNLRNKFKHGYDIAKYVRPGEKLPEWKFDETVAIAFLAERYGLDRRLLIYGGGCYEVEDDHHNFGQLVKAWIHLNINGIRFANVTAEVVIDRSYGKIVSVSIPCFKLKRLPNRPSRVRVGLRAAINAAKSTLGRKASNLDLENGDPWGAEHTYLNYVAYPDGSATLVYTLNRDSGPDGPVYVDAYEGTVVAVGYSSFFQRQPIVM